MRLLKKEELLSMCNIDTRPDCMQADQVQYALDFAAAMSALEIKLNEERIFENAVSHTIQTIRDFYDADCVLVIAVNLQSMTSRCIYKTYRHGINPTSIIESLLVPGSSELLKEMMNSKTFSFIETQALADMYTKSYREFTTAGVYSMMTTPYGISSEGLVMVCNPQRYGVFGTLLQFASYTIAVELSVQKKTLEKSKPALISYHQLLNNEIYVKLLDGFELHTPSGIATEQSIGRKQGILFLVFLLLQKGRLMSVQTLLHSLWENPDLLDDPERALRNLGYSVRKRIEPLFCESDFLEIHKSSYAINRKYTIITDFDCFVLHIRKADEVSDIEARLECYVEALDSFHGVVLPRHNPKLIERIVEQYDRKRNDVQNLSLSLMFFLNQFERMNDFIDQTSLSRGWDRDLRYWDIKAKVGMQMLTEAKEALFTNKEIFSELQLKELSDITHFSFLV